MRWHKFESFILSTIAIYSGVLMLMMKIDIEKAFAQGILVFLLAILAFQIFGNLGSLVRYPFQKGSLPFFIIGFRLAQIFQKQKDLVTSEVNSVTIDSLVPEQIQKLKKENFQLRAMNVRLTLEKNKLLEELVGLKNLLFQGFFKAPSEVENTSSFKIQNLSFVENQKKDSFMPPPASSDTSIEMGQ